MRRELRGALTYPAILLVASLLVIAAIVFLLAPTLAPIFRAVNADPPWTIQAMMTVRNVVLDHGLIILVALAVLAGGLLVLARWRVVDLIDLRYRLPLLGIILREADAGRSLAALGLLLESGAPLPAALGAAREAAGSAALRQLLGFAEEHVTAGGKLRDCLDGDVLPDTARHMIRLGEESNRLAAMLRHAAAILEARASRRTARVIQLLTPALTLVIGLIVGFLIYTTLTAVLDINDLALQ